jgi:hypothetical protein
MLTIRQIPVPFSLCYLPMYTVHCKNKYRNCYAQYSNEDNLRSFHLASLHSPEPGYTKSLKNITGKYKIFSFSRLFSLADTFIINSKSPNYFFWRVLAAFCFIKHFEKIYFGPLIDLKRSLQKMASFSSGFVFREERKKTTSEFSNQPTILLVLPS